MHKLLDCYCEVSFWFEQYEVLKKSLKRHILDYIVYYYKLFVDSDEYAREQLLGLTDTSVRLADFKHHFLMKYVDNIDVMEYTNNYMDAYVYLNVDFLSLYIHKELNVGILGDNSLSVLSCMKEVLKDTPVNLLFE